MTTSEALAVVREALAKVKDNHDLVPMAEAALTEIEKRLREAGNNADDADCSAAIWRDAANLLEKRAEKAEAERDELLKRVPEVKDAHDHWKSRAVAAEQRVAELGAALREIADDEEPNHYRRLQGIARRALGRE